MLAVIMLVFVMSSSDKKDAQFTELLDDSVFGFRVS